MLWKFMYIYVNISKLCVIDLDSIHLDSLINLGSLINKEFTGLKEWHIYELDVTNGTEISQAQQSVTYYSEPLTCEEHLGKISN